MEYMRYECDVCGQELALSFNLTGATLGESATGRPVKDQLDQMESRVEILETEVRSVLRELDHLAELWGDEGVLRNCRDRLRAAIQKHRVARER